MSKETHAETSRELDMSARHAPEPAENTYPALPVREGENVFVWFASFADEAAYRSSSSALIQSQEWVTSIVPALQMWGASLEEALELLPTRRSLLRHRAEE